MTELLKKGLRTTAASAASVCVCVCIQSSVGRLHVGCCVEEHVFAPLRVSDGDGTHDDLVLQHDTDDQEDKVEHEHEEAQKFTHFPLASCNGQDDKEQHEEEEDYGTEEAIAAHFHSLKVIDDVEEEPRERQAAERTTNNKVRLRSHGEASCLLCTDPTVMSNMLEPTELDTAMSPRPFRATITLVMRSGIDVPAARMVRPMISSVIQNVSPTCSEAADPQTLRLRMTQRAQTAIK